MSPKKDMFLQNFFNEFIYKFECGNRVYLFSDLPQSAYQNFRSQSSADYLTPNSARKIASYSTTPRRLPLQPQQQSTPPVTKAKYRVRFADEVDSGASTSSGTSSTHISPRNDPQEMLMNSGKQKTRILRKQEL